MDQVKQAWDQGAEIEPLLDQARAAFEQAIAEAPDARILRASLLVVQAQHTADAAARRERGTRATDDFAKALAVNPGLEKAWKRQVALAQQFASALP